MTTRWRPLPIHEWTDTLETLHLWTQVVGKIRMGCAPWLNHSWSVPLYVSPRGLRTSFVPYEGEGFELAFDLLGDRLTLDTTTGEQRSIALAPRSVADFYADVMAMMADVGMPVEVHTTPSEIADAIPFPDDDRHDTYEPDHARALWQALIDSHRVMARFRAGFRGKASPVHFFWGSFDLAVTRFSGRTAPPHGGGVPNFPDDVAQEAYSHEVTSVGFWPGNRESPEPIYYAYAYPMPDGFADATVAPDAAFWLDALGEFALPYSAVASAADPDDDLLAFFESTHAAAADLAGWDRVGLECATPHGPDWWATRPHPVATTDAAGSTIEVRDDTDRHRYVVLADGEEMGAAVYHRRGDRWIFVHTEIDDRAGGQGVGSRLVQYALDDVRSQDGHVVPLCPFVRGWIERHPEYADLVDQATTDRLLNTR